MRWLKSYKIDCGLVVRVSEYTKKHWILHFKSAYCMVYELRISKDGFKKLSKELYKKFLELWNIINENFTRGALQKFDSVEEIMSELEDRSNELIQCMKKQDLVQIPNPHSLLPSAPGNHHFSFCLHDFDHST